MFAPINSYLYPRSRFEAYTIFNSDALLSNEEKTKDYENFEKGMIYMKILKKGGQ
jgi:hypothetical protein